MEADTSEKTSINDAVISTDNNTRDDKGYRR